MSCRKVSAHRGLAWLAQAWRMIWLAPKPFIPMVMWLSIGLLMPVLSLFSLLMVGVLYGGVISALHKKNMTGQANLTDIFNGFKSAPHFLGLWAVGSPVMVFALLSSFALVSAIGSDMAQQMAQGQPPDQKVMEALLPVMMSTMLNLLPLGALVFWLVFIAVPRVMLDSRGPVAALIDAVRAIFVNFFALFLFTLAYGVAMGVTLVLLAIPVSLFALLGPLGGIAQAVFIMFMTTLCLLLYLAAMYCAWQDMYQEKAEIADSGMNKEKIVTPDTTQIEV
jgi:hypothetical protein